MIWNDLSGEEEEWKSSFVEDEELKGSISATDLFAEFDGFDDIISGDDDFDDDGYLPQASDNRLRFPLVLKKRNSVFPCKPDQKLSEHYHNWICGLTRQARVTEEENNSLVSSPRHCFYCYRSRRCSLVFSFQINIQLILISGLFFERLAISLYPLVQIQDGIVE